MEPLINYQKLTGQQLVKCTSAEQENLMLVETLYDILRQEWLYEAHTSAKLASDCKLV